MFYQYLNENDRKVAKKRIMIEMAKAHRLTAPSNASASFRFLGVTAASSGVTRSTFDLKVFDEFERVCGLKPSADSSPGHRRLTIDEEISFYIKAIHMTDKFQVFWKHNQSTLPRLASLVRRYNIYAATSVASDSTFSVAGYLNREQRSSLSPTAMRYSVV